MEHTDTHEKLLIPSTGFCLIDKPVGVSSFDIVAAARGALKTRRVGHAGTLDPLASGLLLLGFGSLTHLLPDLTGEKKTYQATIRLGVSTSTDDSEGDFHPEAQSREVREKVASLGACPQLIAEMIHSKLLGTIHQVPSTYSAVRIHGQHAYDLARSGQSVSLPAREVTIHSFSISNIHLISAEHVNAQLAQSANPHNHANEGSLFCDFQAVITCSAGTYIRSLARDLGHLLGTGGYITQLRRTSISHFRVEDALVAGTREKTYQDKKGIQHTRLAAWIDPQRITSAIIPAAQAVKQSLPWIPLTQEQMVNVSFGRKVEISASDVTALKSRSGNIAGEVVGLCGPTAVAKGVIRLTSDANHAFFQPRTVFIAQIKETGIRGNHRA
jgi:tRNA pseudouridine55 synthase